MGDGASFYNQRLHLINIEVVHNLIQHAGLSLREIQALKTRMMAVDDQSQRVLAAPISYVELAMVALISNSTHQDSIVLGTKLVRKHLGKWRRNRHTLLVIIQIAIHRLRPFQGDVWSLMGIESDETLVEFEAFRLQNAYCYLASCLANLLDSPPLHLGKRIYAAADASHHALPDDQVGTRRRLAIMRTGFETHIDSGLA